MMRSLYALTVFLAFYGLVGCSQQAADSAAESTKANSSTDATIEAGLGATARQDLAEQQLPVGLTNATPPDQIVEAFLNALRTGDSGVAEALLTRQAREETRKRDLTVQQLGAPDATFTIGTPEYLGTQKNGVHVNTTWTEEQGAAVINYDIVWALRRHDVGWRVAGMGAQLGPEQPVVYLNFEDPDDMLAKWREADDAVAASQAPDSEVRQAQNPQAPGTLQR
jgi:hypothetical protein